MFIIESKSMLKSYLKKAQHQFQFLIEQSELLLRCFLKTELFKGLVRVKRYVRVNTCSS